MGVQKQTTMAGSEEYDEEDVYLSDEEVTCIMHMPTSLSSSSEELEPEMTGTSSSSPEFRVPSPRQVKDEFQIFSESPILASTHPVIIQRLKAFGSGLVGCTYVSLSSIFDWTLQSEKPTNIICDACILSPTRPVTLLTFKRQTDKDKSVQYNAKLARHLITSVRKDLFPNFTVVSGVVDIQECLTDDTFQTKIKKFESDARTCSVPRWLNMDKTKHDKLLDFFRKKVPTFGKEGANQKRKESLRQHFLDAHKLEPSFTPRSWITSSDSTNNGSDMQQQRRDDVLARVAREMQKMNENQIDMAQKVKELSEEVHNMRTSVFIHNNHYNRLIEGYTSTDVGVQTPAWEASDERKEPDVLLIPSAHDWLSTRRPSAPPPYDEAVRRLAVIKGTSGGNRRLSLGSQESEVQVRKITQTSYILQMRNESAVSSEDSSESLDQKEGNLTDNQKFRRTKSDKSKSTRTRMFMGRRASSFC